MHWEGPNNYLKIVSDTNVLFRYVSQKSGATKGMPPHHLKSPEEKSQTRDLFNRIIGVFVYLFTTHNNSFTYYLKRPFCYFSGKQHNIKELGIHNSFTFM